MSPVVFKARVGRLIDIWQRCVTLSLRFTSGATPDDLLAASMAAESFSYYEQALVGLETRTYLATAASQCETRLMLYRLSYSNSTKLLILLTDQKV